MRVKASTAAIVTLLMLPSCGSGSTPEGKTETSTTNRPIRTTSTTVFKGNDCSQKKLQELFTGSLLKADELNDPEDAISQLTAERQRIRRLDLPTIEREQTALVNSLEGMIVEIANELSNRQRTSAYNTAVLRWSDAWDDFKAAYTRECKGL